MVEDEDDEVLVAAAPPIPVYTIPAVPLDAPAGRVVDADADVELVVVTLTLIGF